MKIVLMNGGLGNQLYQYAFLRLLELQTGESCLVDDSAFWGENVGHNGYEIEKIFGRKLNLLSSMFSEDVWNEMLRLRDEEDISIPQQLKNNGIDLTILEEFPSGKFDGNIVRVYPNCDLKEVLYSYFNVQGNFYYYGYWCRPAYVNSIRSVLWEELVFPELETLSDLSSSNIEYREQILNTNSVAMHIRRGDFLNCGRAVSPEKYAKAVNLMEEKSDNNTYFVFSDDITWCKEHTKELGLHEVKGKVVYISGNTGNGYNYVDMQLMSMCKNMIISNSSFGCWAYFFNRTPNVDVIIADGL